jgi:hypothetical protein
MRQSIKSLHPQAIASAIEIDFGTANSSVALADRGQRELVSLNLSEETPLALLLVGDSGKFVVSRGKCTAVTLAQRVLIDVCLLAGLP